MGGDEAEEEPWERIGLSVRPEARAKIDQALALAGKVLGAAAPKWKRVEALCEEYLGAHPGGRAEETENAADQLLDHAPSGQALEELKAWLEEETQRWDFIRSFDPAPRPAPDREAAGGGLAVDPVAIEPVLDLARLDADLRRLRDLRARWDDLLGHLAMLLRQLGLWRDMQFVSFGHYCAERLGMSERAVSQRVALERRLYELPALRTALRDGRVTYEKARIVAAHADEQTLDAWIGGPPASPASPWPGRPRPRRRRRRARGASSPGGSPPGSPRSSTTALRAAQTAAGRFLTPGEALELIAEHFIATWEPLLAERNTIQKRVLARDRGWCQVPGCSRAALHAHHVRFRSHDGATAAENLVSLCAAHHLHGVHAGYLRVVGVAPHRLRWTFRPGGGPVLGPVVVEAPGLVAA